MINTFIGCLAALFVYNKIGGLLDLAYEKIKEKYFKSDSVVSSRSADDRGMEHGSGTV